MPSENIPITIITPTTDDHIIGTNKLLDIVAKERKYITFYEAPPVESTRAYIHAIQNDSMPYFIVIHNEHVIGICDTCRREKEMNHHVGTFGILIHPDYRGKGIGQPLAKRTIDAAFENKTGITRIELTVNDDNPSAVALYRKLGFTIEGHHINEYKTDGKYGNIYSMALLKP